MTVSAKSKNLIVGISVGGAGAALTAGPWAPGPGRGHVVDFIDYFGLFVGNVADIAIVGAAAFIMVLAQRGVSVGAPVHHPEHADG